MKRFVLASVVLIWASLGNGQEKKFHADEAIADLQRMRQEMTESLKTIRTKAEAEKAAAMLAEQGDRIIAAERSLGQFEANLTGRAKRDYIAAMTRKHLTKTQEVNGNFTKALIRLEMERADAYRVLKDNALVRQYRADSIELVRAGIAVLDRNMKVYIESDGKPPRSLQMMVESVYSTVGKEALQDPWGRPYLYDRDGKNNGGNKPDIWVVDPADGKTLIGNWQSR